MCVCVRVCVCVCVCVCLSLMGARCFHYGAINTREVRVICCFTHVGVKTADIYMESGARR